MESKIMLLLVLYLGSAFSSPTKQPDTYGVTLFKDGDLCTIWGDPGATQIHRGLHELDEVILKRTAYEITEHEPIDEDQELLEFFGWNPERVWDAVKNECKTIQRDDYVRPENVVDEVTVIASTGPSSNRIDAVFMGDGYTQSQRDLHLSDMKRLVDDMFNGVTFNAWLPLFNIWAVFRASRQQGIGVNSRPRDTAFRLYRQGNTLRGISTGNAAGARDACSKTGRNGCDFPTLIGNDPYYGGLGGAFTISTSSITSGTVVLRHEMGHNFASVGEEYDGGSAYRGANSDTVGNVNRLKWSHWLSNPSSPRVEMSRILTQAYPWRNLAQGPYAVNFTAQGSNNGYTRWMLRFTVSGCETQNSFQVTLDGRPLPWTTPGSLDRAFTEYFSSTPLSPGNHQLVFRQLTSPTSGNIRMICNLGAHEYGPEPQFHMEDKFYVSAYNTWNSRGGRTLRPGNEHCLMRNMTSEDFCVACIESIWKQFLSRMSLIDGVTVNVSGGTASVSLDVVPVAQFRPGGAINNERLLVRWERSGVAQPQLNDMYNWSLASASGSWTVRVEFQTDEVRNDPSGLLRFSEIFSVP